MPGLKVWAAVDQALRLHLGLEGESGSDPLKATLRCVAAESTAIEAAIDAALSAWLDATSALFDEGVGWSPSLRLPG